MAPSSTNWYSVSYDVTPEAYRHWTLVIEPPVATLTLGDLVGDDGEDSGGSGGLLSSLLRVDIELSDAVQRLRFTRPDVGAVVVTGATSRAFSTIAEIPAGAAPDVAVNVRAFREEVRCAIEDASANSGQHWVAALNGPASGPGFELALACDEIVLVDDGRSAVSLPARTGGGDSVATGGLLRLLDKRCVRPDLVDTFSCCRQGVSGEKAVDWGLVDHIAVERCFTAAVHDHAVAAAAGKKARGAVVQAVELGPLWCEDFEGGFAYPNVRVELDHDAGAATVTIVGPADHECFAPEPGPQRLRSQWWPLAACRELDDAVLRLRSLRPSVDTLVLRTEGDPLAVASADVAMTSGYDQDRFVQEVVLYWKRTLKRLDFAWQSVIALIEPGSCFVGTLLELALAADRAYMAGSGTLDDAASQAAVVLTGMNFGPLPQANGLTRLESRFLTRTGHLGGLAKRVADAISAAEAAELGLVTEAVLEAEWDETIRAAIEARGGLPFATRTALAATRHAAGPATLESKIFSRRELR